MAAEQMNEQEIQFKKRARRRLVGAIALVLLMVTVLPMLLDDRSVKTPQQEITITIPSEEITDFTSKVVPVSPQISTQDVLESDIDTPIESATASEPQIPATAPEVVTSETKVTEPETAEKAAVILDQPATGNDAYAVQIGVFSTMASIEQLQKKLLAQGYKSYTQRLPTDKGEKIRLRAGPFPSRIEAEKALAKIKDAGMSGMVVTK